MAGELSNVCTCKTFPGLPCPGHMNAVEPCMGTERIGPGTVNPPTERDPHGMDPKQPGAKLDATKRQPMSYAIEYFPRAIERVSEIGEFGAKKYTRGGWRSVPDGERRYMEAMVRHLLAIGKGETIDSDSGLQHLAHLVWNGMAVLELKESSRYTRTSEGETD